MPDSLYRKSGCLWKVSEAGNDLKNWVTKVMMGHMESSMPQISNFLPEQEQKLLSEVSGDRTMR